MKFLLPIFLFVSSFSFAQHELLAQLQINTKKVYSKLDRNVLDSLTIFQKIYKREKQLYDLILEPKNVNINSSEKVLLNFYRNENQSISYQIIFKSSDPKRSLDLLLNLRNYQAKKYKAFSYIQQRRNLFAWNNNTVVISTTLKSDKYTVSSNESYSDFVFNKNTEVTELGLKSYDKVKTNSHDAFLTFNPRLFNDAEMIREFFSKRETRMIFNYLRNFIKLHNNSEYEVGLDINQNQLAMELSYKPQKEVLKSNKSYLKQKPDLSLTKYLQPGHVANGSIHFNQDNTLPMMEEFFLGNRNLRDAKELLRVMLKTENYKKVWNGNLVFSYVKDSLKEYDYTTYEIDSEGQEYEVIKKRKKHDPVFLMAFKFNDIAHSQSIIDEMRKFNSIKDTNGFSRARNDDFLKFKIFDDHVLISNDSATLFQSFSPSPIQPKTNSYFTFDIEKQLKIVQAKKASRGYKDDEIEASLNYFQTFDYNGFYLEKKRVKHQFQLHLVKSKHSPVTNLFKWIEEMD